MFGIDHYPTPASVIDTMLAGITLDGKKVLEPSAGAGNIVDYCTDHGAEVFACEIDARLQTILKEKCTVLTSDFLDLTADQVSHLDFIVMNPPFSGDEQHILHAWNIAPEGCQIISLCNLNTVKNTYSRTRKELNTLCDNYGSWTDLGNCFENSERATSVNIGLIRLQKPASQYGTEFEGFFMEDEEEPQGNGIMSYNFIRDLVNRYVEAVKIFDTQLETAAKMHEMTGQFFSSEISMSISVEKKPTTRNRFKIDLQKSAWKYIFAKMNLGKFATRGMREDLNKFIETQTEIPFTMSNIYRMLDIIFSTQEQQIDRAIIEVFEKLTKHYHENRYNVEGWKTNSNYLINEKFILPYVVEQGFRGQISMRYRESDTIHDMVRVLCFITGTNFDETTDLSRIVDRMAWGKWHSWGFFEVRAYKKGTMHFKFNSSDLWGKFNQRVAKIMGYPLYERTKEQEQKETAEAKPYAQQEVLFEI